VLTPSVTVVDPPLVALLLLCCPLLSCAQVVSQFSFAQDNTISDEPVVDLLRFLSSLLHSAAQRVSAASAASGHANLRQLVLVIADGRFHEKVRPSARLLTGGIFSTVD